MKKYIYTILVSCLLSITLFSCDDDAEMLFEETASQRKTAAIGEFEETFKNAEYGWAFKYIPNEDLSYGGYTYVLDFNDKDSVSVYFELASDVSTPVSSLYDIISNGGPVLTFNTYNPFMHYYATPSSSEYNAKGGDYEFLLMSESNDTITLQGTKTGNLMRMVKLTQPAHSYLSTIQENANFIGRGSYVGSIGDTEVGISESNRNFTFSYTEGDEEIVLTVPYLITTEGLSFLAQTEILGQIYQDFTLDKENNKLLAVDGEMEIQIVVPPIDLNQNTWTLDVSVEANASEATWNAWVSAYTANLNTYGETLSQQMTMGRVLATSNYFGIMFTSTPYITIYSLDFNGVPGQSNQLDIQKVGASFNWSWYTHLSPMLDLITDNSPYEVEQDDEDNPTEVKLTSASNPDVWFILKK
ncbi:DUF4302 domain-containing protein [Saccharicrinis fermentans]|uniref:DUF4302 domain-containing protein n=1 Tax=Saccharicrinis fermentans DSM 9555 = JCM 21142 TaxID=869213 RepID=W7XYK4_9BACT|nr:DUF4302 domain-containing protein [Saccharicrinis fermentans]GAF03705.1 hypothetical protein JCM21142_62384 [Saccharicrinis fermentans DSM 9555 = JCM 21142]